LSNVALLLSGQHRGGNEAMQSIKRRIIDVLNPDIFISTCLDEHTEKVFKESKELNAKRIMISKDTDTPFMHPYVKYMMELVVSEPKRSTWAIRITRQWDGMETCFNMAGPWYKTYIRCRLDYVLDGDIEFLNPRENTIYLPSQPIDKACVSDRFAYGDYKAMSVYCRPMGTISLIKDCPPNELNMPETVIADLLNRNDVKREYLGKVGHRVGQTT